MKHMVTSQPHFFYIFFHFHKSTLFHNFNSIYKGVGSVHTTILHTSKTKNICSLKHTPIVIEIEFDAENSRKYYTNCVTSIDDYILYESMAYAMYTFTIPLPRSLIHIFFFQHIIIICILHIFLRGDRYPAKLLRALNLVACEMNEQMIRVPVQWQCGVWMKRQKEKKQNHADQMQTMRWMGCGHVMN